MKSNEDSVRILSGLSGDSFNVIVSPKPEVNPSDIQIYSKFQAALLLTLG